MVGHKSRRSAASKLPLSPLSLPASASHGLLSLSLPLLVLRCSEPAFMKLQRDFLSQHCHDFPLPASSSAPSSALTSHSLQQTQLHHDYTAIMEAFLTQHLTRTLPSFSLASLHPLLLQYQSSHSSGAEEEDEWNEAVDLLCGLSDYERFHQLMSERRLEMEQEEEQRQRQRAGGSRLTSSLDGFGLQIISLKSLQQRAAAGSSSSSRP